MGQATPTYDRWELVGVLPIRDGVSDTDMEVEYEPYRGLIGIQVGGPYMRYRSYYFSPQEARDFAAALVEAADGAELGLVKPFLDSGWGI